MNNIKNSWVVEKIKECEDRKLHGKIIININAGDIPCIQIEERINKPEKTLTKESMNAITSKVADIHIK